MKKFLKSNKGITGADALLAVALIVLFSGIIATLAYNIYNTSNSLKRSSQALEYITSAFEYVANQYYDDVTADNLVKYINDKNDEKVTAINKKEVTEEQIANINKPYIAKITVTNYNETEGNTDKLDLVKEITMSVEYKLGDKKQEIEMKTTKAREKLEVPNIPDLALLAITEGQYKYPIKYVNGNWKVTSKNDLEWYNYNKGMWGTVLVTNGQKVIGDIVTKDDGNIKLWIPRFEYNSNPSSDGTYQINFLYKNTNKQIASENGITKIVERQLDTIPTNFTNEKITGLWIEKGDLGVDPYLYFNNSKYKLDNTKYDGILW